ncbi:MAG: tRNA isopentenyl-2-thiomethyl-A-37 hydroxylase MiaE, partial [Myxococcota bacterium]
MLHLARPSDPEWFERIEDALPTILIDHTHLEKRAASTAMSMIFRYTERPSLARRMSDVVTEEMDHFVRMLDVLEARGIELVRLEPAPYAAHLARHARKQDPIALLDKLLVASLIEARSCERFQILA